MTWYVHRDIRLHLEVKLGSKRTFPALWGNDVTAMHWAALESSAVKWSFMKYLAVQYRAVQCNTVLCNAIPCSTMQCRPVQCNTVQCNAIPCYQYSAVQINQHLKSVQLRVFGAIPAENPGLYLRTTSCDSCRWYLHSYKCGKLVEGNTRSVFRDGCAHASHQNWNHLDDESVSQ